MNDAQVLRDNRVVCMVDRIWREDIHTLPHQDIYVPIMHLPDPEPDNGNVNETMKEIDLKWVDLALGRINNDSIPSN